MSLFGRINDRRSANAKALASLGIHASAAASASELYRVIREGSPLVVFTIGYERRDGDGLISALRDAGIEHLADIRDKPISRKPDFRASALRARCEDAGIEYGPWSTLGSTESQRESLRESGDLERFHKVFRAHAKRHFDEPLTELARVVEAKTTALMCYERAHHDCHRSVIAEMLADRLHAGITAIL